MRGTWALPLAVALGFGALGGLACGGDVGATGEDWIPVVRGDLTVEVDVTGTLTSTRSAPVGPPMSTESWDFKITRMANEGEVVKKGAPVLSFDTSELERELIERQAERDAAAKEIDRKRHEVELARREGVLRVEEAEAAAHKARLKADLPEKYTAEVEMRLAKVDLEAAEAELRMARQRLDHATRLGQAELQYLRERHARFQSRVDRIEETIAAMNVKAPSDGVVVYKSNWRGEKRKVGDSCWVGNPCLEITNTEELLASGEVDEIESAEVRPAQRVRLRLDALPETEWTGRVTALRPNVYRQGPRNPLKVIGVEIALDHRDPGRLRPGMQFRGRLETDRKSGVLLVPVDAVFPGPEGPVAFRRTTTGHERVALRLGRRSRSQVEILAGLAEGDRVARRDLAAGEGR